MMQSIDFPLVLREQRLTEDL